MVFHLHFTELHQANREQNHIEVQTPMGPVTWFTNGHPKHVQRRNRTGSQLEVISYPLVNVDVTIGNHHF